MFQSTNPENANIVERLYIALCALPSGEIVEYETLNRVGMCVSNGKHRHLLSKARERCEKEFGCVFEPVRAIGIKRLPAHESVEVGLNAIRRVRRTAKRGVQRTRRINSNSLSDAERKRVISYSALLGAIAMLADGNKARSLAVVADSVNPIPPSDVLSMFMK